MARKYGSITSAVKMILSKKPYIIPCIEAGIVNYSKLAELIIDEVEKIVGEDVREEAIKMALIRYSKELTGLDILRNAFYILSKSNIQLVNDVVILTIELSGLKKIIDIVSNIIDRRGFIQITQGRNIVTLVVENNVYNEYKDILQPESIYTLKNQSAIIIVSPKEIINTPGIVYLISNILFINKVNITQIISSYLDTIIIIDRLAGSRAFKILDELIRWCRKTL